MGLSYLDSINLSRSAVDHCGWNAAGGSASARFTQAVFVGAEIPRSQVYESVCVELDNTTARSRILIAAIPTGVGSAI